MDHNRRNFLKIIFVGGTVFIVERIIDPLYSRLLDSSFMKNDSSADTKTDSMDFQVVENNKSLSIYDSSGEEVFQIDKGV